MPGTAGPRTGTGRQVAVELAALRRLRRRRRIEHVDTWQALYRAYVAVILAGVALLLLTGAGGVVRVHQAELGAVRRHGPAVVGLAYALVVGLALRSGTRGGPLVLEAADTHHVLAAPVSRRLALRSTAVRALWRGAVWGAVAGASGGVVASRAIGGSEPRWMLWAALSAALAGVTVVGLGLTAAGMRLGKAPAAVATAFVVAWSGFDALAGQVTSPLTLLGGVGLEPLGTPPGDLAAAALAPAAAFGGLALLGGISVEAARRRATLVGLLRFSATTRDFRAVALLRRQLAGERLRRRPWLRLPPTRSGRGWPVLRRDLHGLLRWPAVRMARLLALGIAAGALGAAAWAEAVPLVAVAGALAWVAALDASEGLGQEVDHPDRLASVPRPAGWVLLRHIRFAAATLVPPALAGVGTAVVLGGTGVLPLALTTAAASVACSAAAAAVTVLREPADAGDLPLASEIGATVLLVRELLPVGIATAGFAPVAMGRLALLGGRPPLPAALNAAFFVMLAPVAVLGWVHSKGRVGSGPSPQGEASA